MAVDDEKSALRKLMKARIACANSVHELETLDGLTDDWDKDEDILDTAALDIHLECEYSSNESKRIHEALTNILAGAATPGWLWAEIEVRQEKAVKHANEIFKIVDSLLSAGANPELGIKEMKGRAQKIVADLSGLQATFAELEKDVRASQAGRGEKQEFV